MLNDYIHIYIIKLLNRNQKYIFYSYTVFSVHSVL